MTNKPSVSPNPLVSMRTFIGGHFAWMVIASLGLVFLGKKEHLAGLWLAGGINLLSLYPVLRFLQDSPSADQATLTLLRAKLSFKFMTVIAALGFLMYLRPALGAGVAIAYVGILPAVLAVAGVSVWQQHRHGSS